MLSDQQANFFRFCYQNIVAVLPANSCQSGVLRKQNLRIDDMMVENNDDVNSSLNKTHLSVSLGKAQVFVRLNERSDLPESGYIQERQSCILQNISKEFCLCNFIILFH